MSPRWDTSCLDWERRIMAGESLVPDLPLFQDEAERALRIFKRLRLPDVIGTPRMSEASGEWFFDIVEALFGAYDAKHNKRMVQEYFLLVPKKNGKSSYAAAIMVVAIIVNRRPNAEFLLIAPTKEIADISFRQASGIIRLDPELSKLFLIQRHIRTISHRESGSTIQIKAADTDVITGSKSTGILVDETHVFAKKSNAAELFVEVRGALNARPDGFMIQISTQSKDPPSGVFRSELNVARDVRDGKLKLPRLAVLYELPDKVTENGGWKNQATWPLVNPNMGRSVSAEFLADELVTAEREGASQLALLASQHFNVEIGQGLRSDRWTGADFWRQCGDGGLGNLDTLLDRCDVATVGIDGGGLDDLLGLCVLGREKETRRWLAWFHAWAHEIVLERRKEIAPKLLDFKRDGNLTIVANDSSDDIRGVADIVEKISEAGLLPSAKGIGVDPAGVADIVDELERRGFTTDDDTGAITAIRQGFWTLNNTTKSTERRLAARTLVHGGSALMTWCVANAKLVQHGNAVTIEKQASGTAKIDPLMALFNAVALMALNPVAAPKGRLDDFLTSHLAA
jgi:phage terminase large subunit-like protein